MRWYYWGSRSWLLVGRQQQQQWQQQQQQRQQQQDARTQAAASAPPAATSSRRSRSRRSSSGEEDGSLGSIIVRGSVRLAELMMLAVSALSIAVIALNLYSVGEPTTTLGSSFEPLIDIILKTHHFTKTGSGQT
jgi:soluble lytic murein transglycosylase-like protein